MLTNQSGWSRSRPSRLRQQGGSGSARQAGVSVLPAFPAAPCPLVSRRWVVRPGRRDKNPLLSLWSLCPPHPSF